MRTIILGLALSAAFAQEVPTGGLLTHGMSNGRFWRTFDRSYRQAFLLGYRDGVNTTLGWLRVVCKTGCDATQIERQQDALLPKPALLSSDELLSAINQFYEEPANRQIPIGNDHASFNCAGSGR